MTESALDWLAKETGCSVVKTMERAGDTATASGVPAKIAYTKYGEDEKGGEQYVPLDEKQVSQLPPVLCYFMDGSRRAWKIADFRSSGNVWPIYAGQIGVGYLCRRNRKLAPGERIYKTVLSVPEEICPGSPNAKENEIKLHELLDKFNARVHERWFGKIRFDSILPYKTEKDEKKDIAAVSRIQALMSATEKRMIVELADCGKLNPGGYLVKDGTLEYRDDLAFVRWSETKNRLCYAIGVSKSFNEDLHKIKIKTNEKSAAEFISRLPCGYRTRAFHYAPHGTELGKPQFAVWYVRIRNRRINTNVYDGVLKVEMQLLGQELEVAKSSLEIDRISTELALERNPVCFGKDNRWANHIYPVYLTEQYLKSGFLPEEVFRQIVL